MYCSVLILVFNSNDGTLGAALFTPFVVLLELLAFAFLSEKS
jgi:hypothetical protein